MEAVVNWEKGMTFKAQTDPSSFAMDAPIPLGHHEGPNPKEVLLSSLAACAGMDVIGYLKKKKHNLQGLKIKASGTLSTNKYPQVFLSLYLTFEFSGFIYYDDAFKAVQLSQTKYSGISAMLCQAAPLHWQVFVDGEKVGDGKAAFDHFDEFYQSSFEG